MEGIGFSRHFSQKLASLIEDLYRLVPQTHAANHHISL
jgi:hypothetical protein